VGLWEQRRVCRYHRVLGLESWSSRRAGRNLIAAVLPLGRNKTGHFPIDAGLGPFLDTDVSSLFNQVRLKPGFEVLQRLLNRVLVTTSPFLIRGRLRTSAGPEG
jgi:hypothetical protein